MNITRHLHDQYGCERGCERPCTLQGPLARLTAPRGPTPLPHGLAHPHTETHDDFLHLPDDQVEELVLRAALSAGGWARSGQGVGCWPRECGAGESIRVGAVPGIAPGRMEEGKWWKVENKREAMLSRLAREARRNLDLVTVQEHKSDFVT